MTVANASPPKGGRPTREQAERRHEELLDAALDYFLEKGFELATVEAICSSVNMTKRTVYARYPSKASLFLAAVRRAIDRLRVDEETLQSLRRDSFEQTLKAVALWRVHHIMTPLGMTLQRVLNAESYRFPEIFSMSFDIGAAPVVKFIADQLREHAEIGTLAQSQPERAAAAFIGMTIGGVVRIVVSGNRLTNAEIEDRIDFAVTLFLEGARAK